MAYAAIVSLKQTLEPLLDPGRSRIQIPNPELRLIYNDLCYAKSFLDKINSLEDSNTVEEVEKEIKDVVQNTLDLIEFHLSDLVHSVSESSISVFSAELVEVKEKLGSLIKVLKAKEYYLTGANKQQSGGGFGRKIVRLADDDVSSSNDFGKNKLVGLDDELLDLLDRLTQVNHKGQVISIVGMGGIGKTTLAKAAYYNPLIIEHFDIRLFVELDMVFELKQVLLRLLGQLFYKGREEVPVEELGFCLYKYLYGKRYLVVLDDIWFIHPWTELQRYLPNNQVGSRIIFTTRISYITDRVYGEDTSTICKRLLDNEESWDLLCNMAFSDMECPRELEKIGRNIADSLRGLPLGIVMIGKLLSKSERSPENWMAVAQNIDSSAHETAIRTCMQLSYTELPQHLKACFLYLGIFPPTYDIPTSQLIKLWVVEGFIVPVADKSLEQKAEEYLEDLVSRSLVTVHELSSTGRIKTCGIHPLLKDLCVSEARQEKLFHIVNEDTTSAPEATRNQRRLGIQNDVVLEATEPGVRSLVFISPRCGHPLRPKLLLQFRWLRVLHAPSIRFRKFPSKVVKLVRLRYLAITYYGKLPSSISRLRNLEVLIIHPKQAQTIKRHVFLPLEIWKLHKLRHLQCVGFDLPNPSAASRGNRNDLHLEQLLTLSGVSAHSCTKEVLARMPGLIKLGIRLEATYYKIDMSIFFAIYTNLRLLESLKCAVMCRSEAPSPLIGFPSHLRKLTLSGCGFLWDKHMRIISSLPNLQVLKLQWHSFCGHEWLSFEGGFMSLKYLLLEDLDIEHFMAESEHFPVLEHLLIRRCYKMREIPYHIGDIPTLRVIELHDCSTYIIKSATEIKVEQESMGNDDLQVRIHSSRDDGKVNMTDSLDSATSKCHCC